MTPTTAAERLTEPATVKVGDQSIDLPVLRGSEGETATRNRMAAWRVASPSGFSWCGRARWATR